jgi:putative ABC transport system permease protein
MIKNYFKIAIRNILRNKVFTAINVLGLSIGLCCCLMLFLYVKHELSYDKFIENSDSIFRLWLHEEMNGNVSDFPITSLPYGPALVKDFPEVINMARISSMQDGTFSNNNKEIQRVSFLYADTSFLKIFSIKLVSGNIETALEASNSLVLTKTLAEKLFEKEDPIGKAIRLNNSQNLMITAVVEDFPDNSHLKFDALLPMENILSNPKSFKGWDGNFSFYSYILLNKFADPVSLAKKFPELMEEHVNKKGRQFGSITDLHIRNIKDIHLHSNTPYELKAGGNLSNIYIFSAIAFFILIIACINFMNLSTARSLKRAKEIGIRKVLGSYKSKIIGQFLGESVLLCFIAMVFALIFIEIFQPYFNQFTGLNLSLYNSSNRLLLAGLPFAVIFVGIIAGSYPAFFMSAFKPVKVLKGNVEKSNRKVNLRNALVILQFIISVALIVSTIIIYQQIDFLNNKNFGYKKAGLLVLSLDNKTQQGAFEVLKNEFLNLNGVENVSGSSALPVEGLTQNGYFPEGWDKPMMLHLLEVDKDYIDTYKMEIVDGRNFSDKFKTDKNAFLINETAAKKIGWNEAVGKTIRRDTIHKVVGVVKDFHFTSLHIEIAPLVISLIPKDEIYVMTIKVNSQNLSQTLEAIKEIWNTVLPDQTLSYSFLDKRFENIYLAETRFGTIFISFTFLAIFIACLGLLGLSAFMAEQRTKEIGIRKVLGASQGLIFRLLSKNYIILVFIANLIAWPIVWFGMTRWLENFAYSINISLFPFVWSLIISILISIVIIYIQTSKVVNSNPVDALKYE